MMWHTKNAMSTSFVAVRYVFIDEPAIISSMSSA